ncbi:MAG: tail length tape measure protein [Plesiomonas sp.]|uniref:tail length tape measure protein n=1 Tax=Plesiomonas sp. TaxID=2486279 RepID=UPI003F35B28D
MAKTQNQYFLQSIEINEKKIPRESIIKAAYIEATKLESPLLILNIRDMTGNALDNLGIKRDSIITATMGDPEGASVMFKETFTVLSAPLQMDTVSITSISTSMRKLLTPAGKPQFFVEQQPKSILNRLTTGLTPITDTFDRIGTYHLNAGEKPAAVINRISKDHGSLAWIARGCIFVKSMSSLMAMKPKFRYEYNNPRAQYHITKMSNINNDLSATEASRHRYVGYSMTDGYRSSGDESMPIKLVADPEMGTLKNMRLNLIPKLDIECAGNAEVSAGDVIEVIIHRYDTENRIDESVPKKMIVARVVQFEDRTSVTSRMILGVPSE